MNASALIGWIGVAMGIAGLVAYFALVLRQPATVRMLNGSGLLLASLALFQARMLTAVARGPFAFATEASVVLLTLSVLAQAVSAWRNRRAWDGVDRRQPRTWDGVERRGAAAGEERA